jgi:phospholipase/lecithinase/hemolysin
MVGLLLFGPAVFPAQAAFTALYVFGDSLSATADPGAPGGSYFYGQRWSNGRVWVEVLAQRQGLGANSITNVNWSNSSKNNSYYDHNSAEVVTDVKNFTAPSDVTNDLFIVWVCNADTFDAASVPDNSAEWTAAINQAQINHLQIITNLYAKGVRTLIMPNVVDISEIPAFNAGSLTVVMHNGCVAYNVAFSNTINQARVLCPGLKIYVPDFFTLLNSVLTNAAYYGLTNALENGHSIDAYDDPALPTLTLNGPGANYIFWDPQDPTAKVHEIMADTAQQLISPVQISKITSLTGSNRLDMANVPIGLNGLVIGRTNLVLGNWKTNVTFISSNATQSVYVPASGPQWFYRLKFLYSWTWP